MKEQIAKFIRTGKFKSFRLKNLIDKTTSEVQDTFYSTKNNLNDTMPDKNMNMDAKGQFNDDAFVTNIDNALLDHFKTTKK